MPSVISGDANVSATEFGYLDGVTSSLQSQIDAKLPLAGGKVLQVVSVTKTDPFSTTSTSYTDITGLSVSITPTLATSKILVMYDIAWRFSNNIIARAQLVRDSTAIGGGTAAGTRPSANKSTYANASGTEMHFSLCGNFLDSPNTTSATTYKMQVAMNAGTLYVNTSLGDVDGSDRPRTASTITVMEISA